MSLLKIVTWTVLLGGSAGRGWAQQGSLPVTAGQPSSPASMGRNAGDNNSPFSVGSQERLEKGRQTDRQRRLVADTEKLLALATQLKADMDKTNKDTLSIEVIKKAEEIEKLAKSVKDRMKG